MAKVNVTAPTILLRLFVSGSGSLSMKAIAKVQHICETQFHACYKLEIIDVMERPELAEKEGILATPTLIKELPLPLRRIVGDLSDSTEITFGLDFRPIDRTGLH